jgi:hypothetical protein
MNVLFNQVTDFIKEINGKGREHKGQIPQGN